jgi:hypothetical protein
VADLKQLPGQLNLRFVNGDELNAPIALNRDITGYSFITYIYSTTVTGSIGGDGPLVSIGRTVTQPTLGIVSATAGTMIMGLSETQTSMLTPGNTYRWFIRAVAPGDVTRTIISGDVVTVAP